MIFTIKCNECQEETILSSDGAYIVFNNENVRVEAMSYGGSVSLEIVCKRCGNKILDLG